jgi:hypothetical protein
MGKNATCEERIAEELASTESWLSETYQKIDKASNAGDYTTEEGLREEVEPYGVSATLVMKLELAGGGPAAWLEVELDRSRWGFEPGRVVYHFADWFDHAERQVSEREAPGMWRMAECHAEFAEDLMRNDRR